MAKKSIKIDMILSQTILKNHFYYLDQYAVKKLLKPVRHQLYRYEKWGKKLIKKIK